jgi:hypothetical protein
MRIVVGGVGPLSPKKMALTVFRTQTCLRPLAAQ